MANVIIVLLIVTYCTWVIYTHFFRKKDGHKCSGIIIEIKRKWKRDIIMGNVSGSTFYMFLGVLVIYLIGVSIYTLVQKIKKKRK